MARLTFALRMLKDRWITMFVELRGGEVLRRQPFEVIRVWQVGCLLAIVAVLVKIPGAISWSIGHR
jgi:hypothetical protein